MRKDQSEYYIEQFKEAAAAGSKTLHRTFANAVTLRASNQGQTIEAAAIYVANKIKPRPRQISETMTTMHEVFNWLESGNASAAVSQGILQGLKLLEIEKPNQPESNTVVFLPAAKDIA